MSLGRIVQRPSATKAAPDHHSVSHEDGWHQSYPYLTSGYGENNSELLPYEHETFSGGLVGKSHNDDANFSIHAQDSQYVLQDAPAASRKYVQDSFTYSEKPARPNHIELHNQDVGHAPSWHRCYSEPHMLKSEIATSPEDNTLPSQSALTNLGWMLCPMASDEINYQHDQSSHTEPDSVVKDHCLVSSLPDVVNVTQRVPTIPPPSLLQFVSPIPPSISTSLQSSHSTDKKFSFHTTCSAEEPAGNGEGVISAEQPVAGSLYQTTFDPRTPINDEDLRVYPIMRKAKKIPVAEECKDSKYWKRRLKNNDAARRSREMRRIKENQIAVRARFLEKENASLKMEVKDLRRELFKLSESTRNYDTYESFTQ